MVRVHVQGSLELGEQLHITITMHLLFVYTLIELISTNDRTKPADTTHYHWENSWLWLAIVIDGQAIMNVAWFSSASAISVAW